MKKRGRLCLVHAHRNAMSETTKRVSQVLSVVEEAAGISAKVVYSSATLAENAEIFKAACTNFQMNF